LLPGTPEDGALRVAENLRVAVSDLRLPHAASSVCSHVTLSLGAATLHPGANHSPKLLIERADAALYEAKHAGRNRCAFAAPIGVSNAPASDVVTSDGAEHGDIRHAESDARRRPFVAAAAGADRKL